MKNVWLCMLNGILLFLCCGGPIHRESVSGQLIHSNDYVWIHIDTVVYKPGGMVQRIKGRVIDMCDEAVSVDSLSETILSIQKRDDGRWRLPPNIYFKTDEIVQNRIYKMLFEYSDTPPAGDIEICPHDM